MRSHFSVNPQSMFHIKIRRTHTIIMFAPLIFFTKLLVVYGTKSNIDLGG